MLLFLITIRSTYTFASRNNAKFGIVKSVILSGNEENGGGHDEEGIRITFKSKLSDAQRLKKLANAQW